MGTHELINILQYEECFAFAIVSSTEALYMFNPSSRGRGIQGDGHQLVAMTGAALHDFLSQ